MYALYIGGELRGLPEVSLVANFLFLHLGGRQENTQVPLDVWFLKLHINSDSSHDLREVVRTHTDLVWKAGLFLLRLLKQSGGFGVQEERFVVPTQVRFYSPFLE